MKHWFWILEALSLHLEIPLSRIEAGVACAFPKQPFVIVVDHKMDSDAVISAKGNDKLTTIRYL